MKFTPRKDQQVAIDHAVSFLRNADRAAKQLYAAPTGYGKSVVQLGVQEAMGRENLPIITPRDEIVQGILDKAQLDDAVEANVWTPITYRNRLMDGRISHPPGIVFDEAHHHSAETWQQVDLLTGLAPAAAYTATPYRGSPRSTRMFRERWGKPLWLMTYVECSDAGYIRLPDYNVLPLVDDDIVEVSNGEFSVTAVEAATVDRLGDLADHCRQWYSGKWDRPTIFSMPSSGVCARFTGELARRGIPAFTVSAAVSRDERRLAFDSCLAGIACLLHINIVTEGVDLPLRRLVDCAPTMSPVKWVQQLGRIMRPFQGPPPEYVCTNRNLLRHAYALEGCVPVSRIAEAEKSFPKTERGHGRVLGMEAIGRFKPSIAMLANGCKLYTYVMSTVIGKAVGRFACLVHPVAPPIWAVRMDTRPSEPGADDRTYGSWKLCDNPPEDLKGFASLSGKEPSPKQQSWWVRSAARFGLDLEQKLTRKSFEALPILSDIWSDLPWTTKEVFLL